VQGLVVLSVVVANCSLDRCGGQHVLLLLLVVVLHWSWIVF
jgi:hypothetical protein